VEQEGVGISHAILSPSRQECTPWAAEATSLLPARGLQRLASRQAIGPRRRAWPGRVAGDGQPARLGQLRRLLKHDKRRLLSGAVVGIRVKEQWETGREVRIEICAAKEEDVTPDENSDISEASSTRYTQTSPCGRS
jgi:hypothetical protein